MGKDIFINDNYITNLISNHKQVSDTEILKILEKAQELKGLKHNEVLSLLLCEDKTHNKKIFEIANEIKERIYGDRIVIFAPIYVSNYCVNKCSYCGFSHDSDFNRRKLNMDEIREEIKILEKMGHKRLAIESGEDPINCNIDYILQCIKTIYDMKLENGEIRRLNVNIAATTEENYKKLKDVGIGTYILFQETYHRETYEKVHLKGPKSNYEYHLTAFDRAMSAGIDDVGGGVLFGLYNYVYEVLGLILHNEYLEEKFGVGFHTVSAPRLCDVNGKAINDYGNAIDDELFKKIVAIIRISIPFTGIIISTRETKEMRKELINMGVSQISAGSSVEVGGYSNRRDNNEQFKVSDHRSAEEIISWLMDEGLVPSFCTACYRKGRTGDRFMNLAKTGNIKNVCLPNGLMTLKEYALDYGDDNFKLKADSLISSKIDKIENEKVKNIVRENLKLLEAGKRDLFI